MMCLMLEGKGQLVQSIFQIITLLRNRDMEAEMQVPSAEGGGVIETSIMEVPQ